MNCPAHLPLPATPPDEQIRTRAGVWTCVLSAAALVGGSAIGSARLEQAVAVLLGDDTTPAMLHEDMRRLTGCSPVLHRDDDRTARLTQRGEQVVRDRSVSTVVALLRHDRRLHRPISAVRSARVRDGILAA